MAGAPGTGGRIFTALGNSGVNVMMISQGSSEANISFVVKQQDGPRAVRVLHDDSGCRRSVMSKITYRDAVSISTWNQVQ